MYANNNANSKGFFTGVLYLMIESAPINPKDRNKFDDIAVTIVNDIAGRINETLRCVSLFK